MCRYVFVCACIQTHSQPMNSFYGVLERDVATAAIEHSIRTVWAADRNTESMLKQYLVCIQSTKVVGYNTSPVLVRFICVWQTKIAGNKQWNIKRIERRIKKGFRLKTNSTHKLLFVLSHRSGELLKEIKKNSFVFGKRSDFFLSSKEKKNEQFIFFSPKSAFE